MTRIRRERSLPLQCQVTTTIGARVDPLDIIARTAPARTFQAVPLTRIMGLGEAQIPQHLAKQAGDSIQARDILISKPINLGMQQLLYRAPGAGRIAAIEGSWMLLDLEGEPLQIPALYRGTVISVMPRVGVVIEAVGALAQGVWGSGGTGYGVLKMLVKDATEIVDADAIELDVRGTILVAGAGITEAALRSAAKNQAQGLIVSGAPPSFLTLAHEIGLPLLVTEGFGNVPMCAPIFELLRQFNGHEAALNASAEGRGRNLRPEVFIPRVETPENPARLAPALTTEIGASVRLTREPYLGRVGKIAAAPAEAQLLEAGTRVLGAEVELSDGARVFVPWTNLELIG
jgi:hypothetical protein